MQGDPLSSLEELVL